MLGLGNLIIKDGLIKTTMWDHGGSVGVDTASEVAGHVFSTTLVPTNQITTVSRTHTAPSDYSGSLRNLLILKWLSVDYAGVGAVCYIKDVEVTVTRGASVVKSFTSDFTGGAGDNSSELFDDFITSNQTLGTVEFQTNSTLEADGTSGWLEITFQESQSSLSTSALGDRFFVPSPGTAGDVVQIDYKIYYVEPYA